MGSRTQRHQQKAAEAYWQRRVFMLVGALFAVAVVAWSCSGTGAFTSSGNQPQAQPKPTVTVTVTVTASQAHRQVPADQRCSQENTEVRVGASRETYRAGQTPRFTVVVANNGNRTCKRAVGAQGLRLVVATPDGESVWQSNHCADRSETKIATLSPGEEYSTHLTWNRRTSAPGCPDGQPRAPAGTYRLQAAAGGVASQILTFYLR